MANLLKEVKVTLGPDGREGIAEVKSWLDWGGRCARPRAQRAWDLHQEGA